jgi:tetratricopeptide (TPR) repeat protein
MDTRSKSHSLDAAEAEIPLREQIEVAYEEFQLSKLQFGSQHIKSLAKCDKLVVLYYKNKDYRNAVFYYRHLIDGYKFATPKNILIITTRKVDLAFSLMGLKQYDEAIDLLTEAWGYIVDQGGVLEAYTIRNIIDGLVDAHIKSHKYEIARSYYNILIEILTGRLSAENLDVLLATQHLAKLYRVENNLAEAVSICTAILHRIEDVRRKEFPDFILRQKGVIEQMNAPAEEKKEDGDVNAADEFDEADNNEVQQNMVTDFLENTLTKKNLDAVTSQSPKPDTDRSQVKIPKVYADVTFENLEEYSMLEKQFLEESSISEDFVIETTELLASLKEQDEKWHEAEKYYRKLLHRRTLWLGPADVDTLKTWTDISKLLLQHVQSPKTHVPFRPPRNTDPIDPDFIDVSDMPVCMYDCATVEELAMIMSILHCIYASIYRSFH